MSIFLNLPSIAENKEAISSASKKDFWRTMEYTTALGKGQLLIAENGSNPEPLVLDLKLSGWQKIYVGMFYFETEDL